MSRRRVGGERGREREQRQAEQSRVLPKRVMERREWRGRQCASGFESGTH